MSEEIATLDPSADLIVYRPPNVVLEEAQRAAAALKDVLDKKPRKVMFNKEQYLEFEDWTLLGKFYGVTAKVDKVTPITLGDVKGFEAVAQVIRLADGAVISSADSMCLQDEPNWQHKPLFQLRSMAQTRACAKALRNVLSWVVVLAGYRPTPAEEMDGVFPTKNTEHQPQPVREDVGEVAPPKTISGPQAKRLFAIAHEHGWEMGQLKAMLASFGFPDSASIRRDMYEELIALIEKGPEAAGA